MNGGLILLHTITVIKNNSLTRPDCWRGLGLLQRDMRLGQPGILTKDCCFHNLSLNGGSVLYATQCDADDFGTSPWQKIVTHTHIYIYINYLLIDLFTSICLYTVYIYICMIQNKKETEQNHPHPLQNLPMRPWLVLRYLKCRSSHSKLLGPNLAQLQLYPLQILYGGCSPFMVTYDNI